MGLFNFLSHSALASSPRVRVSCIWSPDFLLVSLFSHLLCSVNLSLHRVWLRASPQKGGLHFEKQDIRRSSTLRISGYSPQHSSESWKPSTLFRALLLVLGHARKPDPFRLGLNSLNILDILLPTLTNGHRDCGDDIGSPADPTLLTPVLSSVPRGAPYHLLRFHSCTSCFLSPSACCCPASLQTIIYPQAILATCRPYYITMFSLDCFL